MSSFTWPRTRVKNRIEVPTSQRESIVFVIRVNCIGCAQQSNCLQVFSPATIINESHHHVVKTPLPKQECFCSSTVTSPSSVNSLLSAVLENPMRRRNAAAIVMAKRTLSTGVAVYRSRSSKNTSRPCLVRCARTWTCRLHWFLSGRRPKGYVSRWSLSHAKLLVARWRSPHGWWWREVLTVRHLSSRGTTHGLATTVRIGRWHLCIHAHNL